MRYLASSGCIIQLVRALLVCAVSALSACASRPPAHYVVSNVEITGNSALSDGEIEESLATRQSPKILGLGAGLLFDYETFARPVLEKDLERVRRLYHAHGYYQAQVHAGRFWVLPGQRVRVEIVVEEGPVTRLRTLDSTGLRGVPEALRKQALEAFSEELVVGAPFTEEGLEAARTSAHTVLENNGYPHASVDARARVDLARNEAHVALAVEAGQRARLGDIRIVGLGKIPEAPVRQALDLQPGELYSKEELTDAEQAVMDLGVFTSVTVDPQLVGQDEGRKEESTPGQSVVPLQVEAHPAALRTLRLGGGAELDIIRTSIRGLASWEHRNFFGGLRRFSVGVEPGLVLYPTRVPEFHAPERLLPEIGVNATFEQPGFLEARTKGFTTLGYDIYPILLTPNRAEGEPIIGYRELRGSAGVERRFSKLTLTPSYNIQAGVPFTYLGDLDPSAADVYISLVELHGSLDLRDDKIQPRSGAFFISNVQFAGLGGDARDIRFSPEARFYVPVVRDKSSFAMRVTFGFLFPFNYDTPTGSNQPSVKETQIAYFRSFFSGGTNSNRGYPYRGVGPHGVVRFFNPNIAEATAGSECDSSSPEFDARRCTVPLGGRSLWELSVAFRFEISGPFMGALFCDSSDVAEGVEVAVDRPHVSCGLGPRYDTPVGPIRLDLAYRIPGLQTLREGGRLEGDPGDLFGLPLNFTLGIGQAY